MNKPSLKIRITILFSLFSLHSIGQEKTETFYFEQLKIIAMDTTHYISTIGNEKRVYFLLGEIQDSSYDTITFCRPRFVMCYYANFCDLKEGRTYSVRLKRQIVNPNMGMILKDTEVALSRPPDKQSPFIDRIFYFNYKVKLIIIEINGYEEK